MYAENKTGNLADVDLHNAGTININSQSSAGIYAPKSTVSKVGTIKLKDTMIVMVLLLYTYQKVVK